MTHRSVSKSRTFHVISPSLIPPVSPSYDPQRIRFFNRLPAIADVEFPINVAQVFFYGFRCNAAWT